MTVTLTSSMRLLDACQKSAFSRDRQQASAECRDRPVSSPTWSRRSCASSAICGRGRGDRAGTSPSRFGDPKRRLISAAPFRDRVVHHALHAVIAPLFERGFIDHTYANRVGKVTHRAVARYERLRDKYRYVLRGDRLPVLPGHRPRACAGPRVLS